jgi:hypothetical protein
VKYDEFYLLITTGGGCPRLFGLGEILILRTKFNNKTYNEKNFTFIIMLSGNMV